MKRVGVFIALVVLAAPAFSKNSCATEMCLSDYKAARNIEKCKTPIKDFFSIKKKRNGHFDPGRTLKARRDYIYSCKSNNKKEKEYILAAYGSIVSP